MDHINVRVTGKQAMALKETFESGGKAEHGVDMSSIFIQFRQRRPEILMGAVKLATNKALALVDRLDQLRAILSNETARGFADFFDPLLMVVNAATNGLDQEHSNLFLDFVSYSVKTTTETLVAVSLGKTSLEDGRKYMRKWCATIIEHHQKEIARYPTLKAIQ